MRIDLALLFQLGTISVFTSLLCSNLHHKPWIHMTYYCLQDVTTFKAADFDTTLAYVSCTSAGLDQESISDEMYRQSFSCVESYLFDRSWLIGAFYLFDKRGILSGADCLIQKLGMKQSNDKLQIVGIISHIVCAGTIVGLKAWTISSAFEMSVSVGLQSVTVFLTFNDKTGQNRTFIRCVNVDFMNKTVNMNPWFLIMVLCYYSYIKVFISF